MYISEVKIQNLKQKYPLAFSKSQRGEYVVQRWRCWRELSLQGYSAYQIGAATGHHHSAVDYAKKQNWLTVRIDALSYRSKCRDKAELIYRICPMRKYFFAREVYSNVYTNNETAMALRTLVKDGRLKAKFLAAENRNIYYRGNV